MKFQEYKEQTKRTLPDLGSLLLNTIHMSVGIASETHEFLIALVKNDVVNLGEELTDKVWYAANYAFINNIDLSGFEFSKELMPVFMPGLSLKAMQDLDMTGMMMVFGGEILDMDKKFLAYGKERDMGHAKAMLNGLLTCIGNLALSVDLDMETCMENNINKLRIRFPEKFDANLAINRDHDAERVELEKI